MVFSFSRRSKVLKHANILQLTPIPLIERTTLENGLVTLYIPRFKSKIIAGLLLGKSKSYHIKVPLDEHGSCIWQQIDGQRNIGQIVIIVKKATPEGMVQAEQRIAKYFMQLFHDKFVTFAEII